jgi:hypothetical protein
MKYSFVFIIVTFSIVFASCKHDNFYNLDRIMLSDKETYCIGDSILLIMQLIPQEEEKEIRLYEDLRNIFIMPHSQSEIERNTQYMFDPDGKINTIKITKEKYFERTLRGKIDTNDRNQIIIQFDKYDKAFVFDKSKYFESPDLTFGGLCMPINPEIAASLEEYFKRVEIKIVECVEN